VRRWGWGCSRGIFNKNEVSLFRKDGSGGVFSKASSVTELGWTKVAAIE